jgi:hypothetical protein|tara:strand:- start:840 stop:1151 length:312 start_codon:yes stop_codon:yes gene_type:complete
MKDREIILDGKTIERAREHWENQVDEPDVNNMVSQPSHYADGKVECIDAMVAAFGEENVRIYAEIASFKYIWRMNKKNKYSAQDKLKAMWYLRYSMNDDPRKK